MRSFDSTQDKNPRLILWLIIFLTIFGIIIQSSLIKQIHFKRGLDLEGGTSIVLKADMKNIPSDHRDQALSSAKDIIERRTNAFGVSEPVIQTAIAKDDYRVIVELPGVAYQQAIDLVKPAGKLEFREVVKATSSAAIPYSYTKETGLTGSDLKDATPAYDSNTGKPVVSFRIQDQSQDKFAKVTEGLIGKPMAIYLDQELISAPTVQSSIRDSGQITGNFAYESREVKNPDGTITRILGTKEFAEILNAGALPVPLTELSHSTIGPTLGIESLKKSLLAGVLGFVIIVLFMSALYKKLGLLASLALSLYVLIVLSIFKISSITPYGITLTLSGIAGFILSIGMAVDANILIFERMKEEERLGKPKEVSINLGFSRAWPSIRDSNSSTLITSVILYYFGTGPVKGFALVLAIGVLASMFSAIAVTRTLIRLLYR